MVFACQGQHVIIHIDADDLALGADDLSCHVADLATTAAQVQYDIARLHITGGVTAAIVFLDDFPGQQLQQALVIVDGTAEAGLHCLCPFRIAFQDGGLGIH